jgi:hypothetical protein
MATRLLFERSRNLGKMIGWRGESQLSEARGGACNGAGFTPALRDGETFVGRVPRISSGAMIMSSLREAAFGGADALARFGGLWPPTLR